MGICCTEKKKEIDAGGAPRVPLDIYNESSKGVCKLIIKETKKIKNATGFFFSDISKNKFLVTNYHVISEKIVDSNMTIIIEKYNKEKYELKLNKNERYIKFYNDPLDITFIEINDLKDLCSNIKFLSIDLNYQMGYHIYLNVNIYLLGYPYGKSVECSTGKITNIINNNEFKHNCNTDSGSSGSPILLLSNSTVIGIHKAGIIQENINIGTFISIIYNQNDNILKNYNPNIYKNNIVSNKKKLYNNTLINLNKNIINKNIIIYENYITAEIYIKENEVNYNIRIINSYEAEKRSLYNFSFDENYRNENEIKKCKILIEGRLIPFSYYYKFNKTGTFKIKYSFPNNLKYLCFLFGQCKKIKTLDFSHFNTQNVTNMHGMLDYCSSLTTLDLSNLNTQNVTNMSRMFSGCSSLTNLDLSNFNTQKVTDMSWMFSDSTSLTNIDLSNLNTQNVTDMKGMFCKCSSLTYLDLSNFNTEKVTDMGWMFRDCSSLTNLDLSNFNTQNVTNMDMMFYNCSSLTYLDLSNFYTQNVNNMNCMFYECFSLINLDLSNCNTRNVTYMTYMFYNCSSLTNLDLSNFNTENVSDMRFMFDNCSSLTKSGIICYDKKIFCEFDILNKFLNIIK